MPFKLVLDSGALQMTSMKQFPCTERCFFFSQHLIQIAPGHSITSPMPFKLVLNSRVLQMTLMRRFPCTERHFFFDGHIIHYNDSNILKHLAITLWIRFNEGHLLHNKYYWSNFIVRTNSQLPGSRSQLLLVFKALACSIKRASCTNRWPLGHCRRHWCRGTVINVAH